MNAKTHEETRDETIEKKIGKKTTKTTVKTTISAIKGKAVGKVTFAKDKHEVSFSLPGKVEEAAGTKKKSFDGTWSYRASMALAGKDKDNWRWNWKFMGVFTDKVKKTTLTKELTVDQSGKVKSTAK